MTGDSHYPYPSPSGQLPLEQQAACGGEGKNNNSSAICSGSISLEQQAAFGGRSRKQMRSVNDAAMNLVNFFGIKENGKSRE